MGYYWQARIILAFGALFFVCAAYNLYVLVDWNVRTIEAKATITAIEGYSAESKPGPRSAAGRHCITDSFRSMGKLIGERTMYGGVIADFTPAHP
jgi:hypothetical protein